MASRSTMTPSRYKDRKGIKPRISAKDSKFATILVGPAEEKFTVHEDLLIFHSQYFRAALTGGFREAEEKIVRLKDDHADTFELFVHWLYYQRFPNEDDADELYNMWVGVEDDGVEKTNNLVRLYVFCDKYVVPDLKISTMTNLFNHVEHPTCDYPFPTMDIVGFAFDNLSEDSPLCHFLVDTHCYWGNEHTWWDFADEDWPPVFIKGVLCQYTEFARGDRSRDDFKYPCDYHEHGSDEERLSCEKRRHEE